MAEPKTATQLVAAARAMARMETAAAGLWPRAAALLARQAVEVAMAQLWSVTAPGLEQTSARCQVLCTGTILNDADLGGRVAVTWNVLSAACHHRAYDLAPATPELERALETAGRLAAAVEDLLRRTRA
jgi:hypothetical protein